MEVEKEVIINDLNSVVEEKEPVNEQALYEGFSLVTAVKIILSALYMLLFWTFATMEEVPILVKGIMLVFLFGSIIYLLKDLLKTPKEYIKLMLK